jgi:site-specific DNA recombinase
MTTDGERFAFYGRVSTEDQQEPRSSRAWQLRRSRELVEPEGGRIVAEFFDVGQSRALPWKRRPEASRLLELFPEPDRGFEAVVIGEPQRAFYGAQFALTFPLFEHYGVDLWVPEVGGRIDPGSEAHDLVMTLFGGMSKGERSRIRTRVRNAMAAQAATEGRFLGGRPPYGYRLADAGPHPNPGKAAAGMRAHRLEPDPATAPIVLRIFRQYVAGKGLYAIAEELTRDRIPCPSAYDPARNPHRSGEAWSKSAVRAILTNPRYTGIAVWGRQRREEVLVDVDDVAAGHRTLMRWNREDDWVRSAGRTHHGLISPALFERAQKRRLAGARSARRKPHRTPRSYVLRGLIRCGLCRRRMTASWNHHEAYYRCRYPAEYALVNAVVHPEDSLRSVAGHPASARPLAGSGLRRGATRRDAGTPRSVAATLQRRRGARSTHGRRQEGPERGGEAPGPLSRGSRGWCRALSGREVDPGGHDGTGACGAAPEASASPSARQSPGREGPRRRGGRPGSGHRGGRPRAEGGTLRGPGVDADIRT